jgi:uncharacterized membrane protein
MSTAVWTDRLELSSVADTALKAAARLWLLMAVIGQWAFLYYIAGVYGPSTLTGNFPAWNRTQSHLKGYVAGDTVGNLAFAAHVLLAAIIAFGGAIQLIPQIRARATSIHRWNGRLFLLTAWGASVSGLYMIWVRGASLDWVNSVGVSLNAVLIIVFGALAWRSARTREVSTHRQWALRTFMVANGQWFFRVGLFAWIIVNHAPVGIGKGFNGPFIRFLDFGCYLLPLAVLELYLRARESGPRARLALAGGLLVLTILMSVGIFGVYIAMWRPRLARV